MFKKSWLLLVAFLLLCSPVSALEHLHFNGFIADEVDILPENVEKNLNMTLWDLQKKTGADIAVVIIQTLGGRTVEDVAITIGREYKIGSKEKNNGVVFLTSMNEKRMRIEIGTGLEDKILMSDLENIRDNDILPYYKQKDYVSGISRGTYKLANLVADAEGVVIVPQGSCPERAANSPASKERAPWWCYLIAAILAPFSGRRRRGYGGFGGFGGGGGFGGSGCSGSW